MLYHDSHSPGKFLSKALSLKYGLPNLPSAHENRSFKESAKMYYSKLAFNHTCTSYSDICLLWATSKLLPKSVHGDSDRSLFILKYFLPVGRDILDWFVVNAPSKK